VMGSLGTRVAIYESTAWSFPRDTKTLKSIVYGLFILDVLQTVLVTADAFHWFVYGFGNMNRLNDTFLSSWDIPFLDSVISLVVQLFYFWRIYVLRNSLILPVLIIMVRSPTTF
ncbi:hypothetical protein B0H17DRAFT_943402, partial [Mycena rosella]